MRYSPPQIKREISMKRKNQVESKSDRRARILETLDQASLGSVMGTEETEIFCLTEPKPRPFPCCPGAPGYPPTGS
jgi:hypothetical protein